MIIGFPFFGVLALSALVYWALPGQRYRTVFLVVASLVFISLYDKGAAVTVVLLTAFTYAVAGLIETRKQAKLYHRLGVLGLLAVLGIFKYFGFLAQTLSSLASFVADLPAFHFEKMLLPLGLSYLVFKHLSFLTDVYWKVVSRGRLLDFLLYGSLFTIFVAGPIERYERFKPQIETRQEFRPAFLETAFERIVYGLFKKLVLADWIGYVLAPVWESPHTAPGGLGILALLGYSIQIYMDFSGYSDIAIGSSRLFGLRIMENFHWPYLQPDLSRFWRNWHISLSDWIRDYLFFPLSRMSPNRFWRLVAVPLIAMALCGLWHGAAWHFVLWGLWHGAGLAVLQLRRSRKKQAPPSGPRTRRGLVTAFGTVATFLYVSLGWIWFR